MTRWIVAMGLAALAACSGPPTYSLWKLERATTVEIEGGLDRTACELLQTRHEAKREAADRALRSIDRDLARLSPPSYVGAPTHEPSPTTIVRFKCVRTGIDPETGEPRS